MEHLEMAGALPDTTGTDGLTINDLPDDMIINIFSTLDIKSLLVAAKVSTRWQTLCMAPNIWKYKTFIIHKSNYVEISANIVPVVAKSLKNVKLLNVNLSEAAQLRDSLISYCPNLTHLEIVVSELDSSILYDLHHWPHLEFLCFRVRGKVQSRGAVRYLRCNSPFMAKKLKTLKLHMNSALQAAELSASLISYCPNLTHLEICGDVDKDIFDNLHHWPNLKFLCIFGLCSNLGLDYNFEKLKYLETLMLPNISLSLNSLYSMLKCENLVSINIGYVKNIPADFLKALLRTKQSTLRALYIYGDTLNDDIMRYISNCSLLQELHIFTCETLSDCSLQNFSRLRNLQSLEMFHGNFSKSAMVAYLTNNTFQQMKFIRLPSFFPSDQNIEVFKTNAPNLKHFYY